MSILDILTGGLPGAGSRSGMGSGFNLDSIGSVLQSFAGKAQSAARDFSRQTPGGVGGLMGAGALGAVLGNLMSSDVAKNIALVGAGAVAWNFYKKWASANQEQAEPQSQAAGNSAAPVAEAPQLTQAGTVDPVAMLIARSMIYAAKADGNIDEVEQQRMDTVLRGLGGGNNLAPVLAKIREEPIDPEKLAREVTSHEQGEDVFRLSCSVIDIDHFMERGYLDALAKALKIDDGQKIQLENEAKLAREQLRKAITAG